MAFNDQKGNYMMSHSQHITYTIFTTSQDQPQPLKQADLTSYSFHNLFETFADVNKIVLNGYKTIIIDCLQ